MSKYRKTFYRCNCCYEIHDNEEDAVECCEPSSIDLYVCPECDRDFKTHEEAKECHEACEIKNHMAKLEAAGQQRLF